MVFLYFILRLSYASFFLFNNFMAKWPFYDFMAKWPFYDFMTFIILTRCNITSVEQNTEIESYFGTLVMLRPSIRLCSLFKIHN